MKQKLTPLNVWEHSIGWPYLLIQLFVLPSIIVLLDYFLKLNLSITQLNIIVFIINFLCVILIFHRFLYNQLQRALNQFPQVLLFALIGYLLYSFLSFWFGIVVTILQPEHLNANNDTISEMVSESFWPMFIGTVLLVPITEETLFRGMLFGTLYRKHPVLGYVVSTIIFSAVHVVGYIGQQDALSLFVSFLQYLPAGLALGFAYSSTGTLLTPVMIHCVVNLIAVLAMR